MTVIVETDIFIVGAGPAGGSLASFLAQNGTSIRLFEMPPAKLICRDDGSGNI